MSKKITIADALYWKFGGVFSTVDDKITVWRHPSIPQPNEVECKAVLDEYIAFGAKNLYKEKRRPEYPPIEDLADAIFHEKNGNPQPMSDYLTKVQAIKDKYPKP